MSRTAQIIKEKQQSIITLRHEGQSMRKMDIRPVEICPLVWWVQIGDFWFQPLYLVRCRVGDWMISACVVPTMKHGGGGVMVWGCFVGDTVCDFRIQGTLNQHGYHSHLLCSAIPSGLRLVLLSFIFQQDNDPKHTSRLCKGYLTKKQSDGVLHQMTWPPQSPDLNPIEMVWDEMDSRVKEKHSRCSWLRECQECAKLSSRQRVATLRNLKSKIYYDLTLEWRSG